MSHFDPANPKVADAAESGIGAWDLRDHLRDAASRCMASAKKIKRSDLSAEAYRRCNVLNLAADWLNDNADAVDQAVAAAGGPHGIAKEQGLSDDIYNATWFQYYEKSRAEQQQAFDDLVKQKNEGGLTPSLRAKIDALGNLLLNGGYNPPLFDPDARHAPIKPKPGQPDT